MAHIAERKLVGKNVATCSTPRMMYRMDCKRIVSPESFFTHRAGRMGSKMCFELFVGPESLSTQRTFGMSSKVPFELLLSFEAHSTHKAFEVSIEEVLSCNSTSIGK